MNQSSPFADPALFDLDPRIRWKAAQRHAIADPVNTSSAIMGRFAAWPKYWFGSANAWLVFVGPSPGNSKGAAIDWERDRLPTLGSPHSIFKTYKDSTGFWERMREWTTEVYRRSGVFRDEQAAIGSALLANVIETKEGDSTKIEGEALQSAMPATVAMLELVRPRVVVPMEKRISEFFIMELNNRPHTKQTATGVRTVLAKNQTYKHYKPRWWDFCTMFGPLRIAESPQHPSKRNFYEPSVIDEYLVDAIKDCL